MPRVSVHVVTYNNNGTIYQTLAALIEQTYTDFEVAIVDNASSDDTTDYYNDIPCKVFENDTNIGYAAAHNQAIAATDSDYVLTLNPDIVLNPDFIAEMVTALDDNDQLGSASGCLLRVDNLEDAPKIIDSTGLQMSRSRRQQLRNMSRPTSMRPTQPEPIFGPDGAAAFYRRRMLEDIAIEGEIFDVDFFMHKEDVDVCWRAQLRGWQSIYVPNAIAKHIRHFRPGYRQDIAPYIRASALRNRYFLLLKNDLPRHFWQDIFHILSYDVGILLYILLREPGTISAYTDVIRKRRRMLHKRRIIQEARQVEPQQLRQWFVG
jgi:GT2 family glycosyltransferase